MRLTAEAQLWFSQASSKGVDWVEVIATVVIYLSYVNYSWVIFFRSHQIYFA
jgi:hypothetical protein